MTLFTVYCFFARKTSFLKLLSVNLILFTLLLVHLFEALSAHIIITSFTTFVLTIYLGLSLQT